MKKHFITITLLLLCLLSARPADARLTLGVVIGPEGTTGSLTREQAQSLANLLVEKLQEDIVVREMADIASMINWLDQYASLDLALMPASEVAGQRGRLLLIGPLDKEGNVNLVTRQGIGGDLPQRAARVVREIGLFPWRAEGAEIEPGEGLVIEEPAAAVGGARTIDEVIAAQVESSVPVVPVFSKAEEKSAVRPVRVETVATKKLVLAVIPELGGALQTTAQAEGVASYLEKSLPVTVQVKEFARADDFTAWFMRYRMVDLAVLPKGFADANLGRDYTALAKLVRAKMPSEAESELLIGRMNLDPALQDQLRAVLLGMMQTAPGTELLSRLNLRQVLDPQASAEVLLVDSAVPEAVEPSDAAVVEPVESRAESLPVELETEPQVVAEAPAPAEPVSPADIVEVSTPELPEVDVTTLPPEPASPDLMPALPAAAVLPAQPAEPVLPGRPALPEPEIEISEPAKVVQPGLPAEPVVPELIAPPVLPAQPTMTDVPQPDAAAPATPVVPAKVKPIVLPTIAETVTEPSEPAMPELTREPVQPDAPVAPAAPAPAAIQAPDELAVSAVAQPVVPVTPSPGALPELPEVSAERVVPSTEVAVVQPPVVPLAVPDPVLPEASVQTQPVAPAQIDQPEAPASVAAPESVATEQGQIVEELLQFAEPASPQILSEIKPVIIDSDALQEDEIIAMLGEDTVASMVAQPDIPQELRPPGVPVVRPRRTASAIDQGLLLTALPDPIPQKEPARPSSLLPEAEPEPGVVYIMPFVSVMVPKDVSDRIFDQFVDSLITAGEELAMQFVILKEGQQKVNPDWLAVRRYVTGEIYAYVEDSGSTATDLRAKARLTYHKPYADQPAFGFMYPFSKFLDNNVSTIEAERIKLADDVATTLSSEFLKALQN